jgi:aminoglycoside phosphotransferase (APT) family kinase protein
MSEMAFAGSGPVRDAHRFDETQLAAWMAAHVEGFAGPLVVEQFKGGQSNPTYRLVTPTHTHVLRRKPPGELLKGAHAVEREARVMRGVAPSGFPVPRLYGLCTDDDVIGTAFYIMDMVEGRIFWDPTLPGMTPADRAMVFDAMNATIASLHSIDPVAAGLGDFGRPGNYFARQIARWTRQYREDEAAGRDLHLDRLVDWLPANIPTGDETAIVHGDFRIDNMIFATDALQVRAVLDWELSTLGHPLADFAYHLMMYRMPPLTIPGLVGADLSALGIPSEADYVAAYCKRTGRDGIPSLDFYLAFNMFRFAAICHGIKGRLARGTATSDHAARLVADLPIIAELGWQQAVRAKASQGIDNV